MAVPVTHNSNISVAITLDPAPVPAAGFGTVMLIVPLASNSLNGERVVAYASVEEAQADQTAGYISATTLAALTAAFSQDVPPEQVKVGYIDLVGAETYSAALTAIITADPDFYGVTILSRTDADLVAISDAVEASSKPMLCAVQSDDASLLTGTISVGLDDLFANERTIVCYHDDDADWMDIAYLANRLAIKDPDTECAAWSPAPVAGVDTYAAMTTAQRNFAIANNVNIGLEFGGEDFVVDAGVTATGRPVYEQLSADWLEARIEERVTAVAVAYGARGEKLPLNRVGQQIIKAEIEALLEQGVAARHFEAGQTYVDAETITAGDRTARRLRFTGQAQIAGSTRTISISLNFSRDAVI